MFLVARMLPVVFACALLCLSVIAAHADNVSRARSIVQNLDDNHFTEVQENGGKIFMFAARDLAYMIQYFPPNGKGPACAITEEYKAVKTIYYDVGCDGSAEGITRQGTKTVSVPESAERKAFDALLVKLEDITRVTRMYKKSMPTPKRSLVPDSALNKRNRELLQRLFDGMESTSLMSIRGSTHVISFKGVEKTTAAFAAKVQGRRVSHCSMQEGGSTAMFMSDPDCDGFFDSFYIGKSKKRRRSDFGNAVVMNAMLQDLLRLTQFAVRHYPKK